MGQNVTLILIPIIFPNAYLNALGFLCGSAGKESACNVGDLGLIPGLGRSSGEGKGYLLQYSDLENAMDCIVLGVTKSQLGLSKFHFTSLHPPEQGGLLGESLKEKVIRRASPSKGSHMLPL